MNSIASEANDVERLTPNAWDVTASGFDTSGTTASGRSLPVVDLPARGGAPAKVVGSRAYQVAPAGCLSRLVAPGGRDLAQALSPNAP